MSVAVSVIIPTYNRAGTLRRAVVSVFAQTVRQFELIVVDDGSQDGTADLLSSIRDPRLIFIRHNRNMGASAARNTGLKASRGTYIAFLDSDDEWFPTKLERQLEVFSRRSPQPGLVYTGIEYVYLSGEVRIIRPRYRGRITRALLGDNVVGGCSVAMLRRDVVEAVGGFDEQLPPYEDADLWLRISQHFDIDFLVDVLARRYMHDDQISNNIPRNFAARELFLLKHQPLFTAESVAQQHHARTARAYLLQGDRTASRRESLRAIRANYLRATGYLSLAVSLLPQFLISRLMAVRRAARRVAGTTKGSRGR